MWSNVHFEMGHGIPPPRSNTYTVNPELKLSNGETGRNKERQMKNTRLDWLELGRFFALVNNIFKLFRDSWKELGLEVGEVIEWLTTSGIHYFEEKIKEVGLEFKRFNRPLDVTNVSVDLYKQPTSTVPDTRVVKHRAMMSNTHFELWWDGLRIHCNQGSIDYTRRVIDVKLAPAKIEPTDEEPGYVHSLRLAILTPRKPTEDPEPYANVNLLRALMTEPHMIPIRWKEMRIGDKKPYFCFFGTIFGSNDGPGKEFFYYMYWSDQLRSFQIDTMRVSELRDNAHLTVIIKIEKDSH